MVFTQLVIVVVVHVPDGGRGCWALLDGSIHSSLKVKEEFLTETHSIEPVQRGSLASRRMCQMRKRLKTTFIPSSQPKMVGSSIYLSIQTLT